MTLNEMQQKAIDHYGIGAQIHKTLEEMEEVKCELLRQEIDKKLLSEEIADLYNMLDQMIMAFDLDYIYIEDVMIKKMNRTIERIKKEGK